MPRRTRKDFLSEARTFPRTHEDCPDWDRPPAIERSDRPGDSRWHEDDRWPSPLYRCCACRIRELPPCALHPILSTPPLPKTLGGFFHALFTRDLQRRRTIKTNLAQFVHQLTNPHHAVAQRDGPTTL